MTDVLGDHGLAQAIGANQDQVAGLGEEVQRKRPFDDIAFDARGPGPVEVSQGLELFDLGGAQAALETAVSALGNFDLRQMLEQLARRPAQLGSVGQHIVQLRGHGGETDPLQLLAEVRTRVRRRVVGQVHRRSPDRVGGLRHSQLADAA